MRRRKWTILSTLCLATSLLLAENGDPAALLQEAKRHINTRSPGNTIPLLAKANAIWEQRGSSAPDYAESLDLEALLLRKNVFAGHTSSTNPASLDQATAVWRAQAESLAQKALQVRESNPGTKAEDMALALELRADTLGRAGEGAPYWKRAFTLRAQRVKEISDVQPPIAKPLAEAVPSQPAEGEPLAIGRGVSAPTLSVKREPQYTDPARLGYYSGSCSFAIVINVDGIPRQVTLTRSLGYGLDEEGAKAVAQWRFKPGMKDGRPVAVKAQVEVNFRLL